MSDFDSLREDFAEYGKALNRRHDVTVSHLLEQSRQIDKLWDDNAALRDELHALANRLEALTNFVTTEPAEVAEAMLRFQCRTSPGCNLDRPHIHHSDGGVIYVQDAETADDQLAQRRLVERIQEENRG